MYVGGNATRLGSVWWSPWNDPTPQSNQSTTTTTTIQHQRGVQEHPELSVGSNADGVEVRSVGNSPVLQDTYLIEAFNLKVKGGSGSAFVWFFVLCSYSQHPTRPATGRHRIHAPELRGGARGAERHAPAAGGGAGPRHAAQSGARADGRGARGGLPQAALPAGAPALPAGDAGQPAPPPVPPPALRRGGRHPAGPRAGRVPPPRASACLRACPPVQSIARPNGDGSPTRSRTQSHRSCSSTWRRRCWWRAAPRRRTVGTTR